MGRTKASDMRGIRSAIAASAGLSPPEWVLEARVQQRMESLGLEQLSDYLVRLRMPEEQAELVDLLRVGETSFFRHQAQMDAVQNTLLPHFKTLGRPIRAWSAGCATGEEAYSLAMLMERGLPKSQAFSVLASDISRGSLSTAKNGVYNSLRKHIPKEFNKYFLAGDTDKEYSIHKDIRSRVQFEFRNLASGNFPEKFDLIFCRNVLIYFVAEAKQQALENLVASLRPGGFLFLGYSESLRGVAGLETTGPKETPVYRKELSRARPFSRGSTPPLAEPKPTAKNASSREQFTADGQLGPALRLTGEYHDAIRIVRELDTIVGLSAATIEVSLDDASYLGAEAARAMHDAHIQNPNIRFIASRTGHMRFLRRHGLLASSEDTL